MLVNHLYLHLPFCMRQGLLFLLWTAVQANSSIQLHFWNYFIYGVRLWQINSRRARDSNTTLNSHCIVTVQQRCVHLTAKLFNGGNIRLVSKDPKTHILKEDLGSYLLFSCSYTLSKIFENLRGILEANGGWGYLV